MPEMPACPGDARGADDREQPLHEIEMGHGERTSYRIGLRQAFFVLRRGDTLAS